MNTGVTYLLHIKFNKLCIMTIYLKSLKSNNNKVQKNQMSIDENDTIMWYTGPASKFVRL